jgi:hypothetical protein
MNSRLAHQVERLLWMRQPVVQVPRRALDLEEAGARDFRLAPVAVTAVVAVLVAAVLAVLGLVFRSVHQHLLRPQLRLPPLQPRLQHHLP